MQPTKQNSTTFMQPNVGYFTLPASARVNMFCFTAALGGGSAARDILGAAASAGSGRGIGPLRG
jgi:hypothetical protein